MALGYKVAIFNVWWRRGEVDTRFFSSKAEQKTYFDSKTLYFNDLNNFNINDNITTVITFRDASGRSIDDLLKCNYAIVKDSNSNYRYFFITAIKQDSGGQVQCTLDLDDIQNNLVGNVSNLAPIFVKKWNGVNYVYDGVNRAYDFSNFSKSFIQTPDAPVLYNKETKDIVVKYTDNDTINEWFNDNIDAWHHVFVADNQMLCGGRPDANNFIVSVISLCQIKVGSRYISLPYGCISEPIYKGSKKIYIKFIGTDNQEYWYKWEGMQAFFNLEGYEQGSSTLLKNYPIGTYGIQDKLSNIPPISKTTNMTIDADGDLIIDCGNAASGSHNPSMEMSIFYMAYKGDGTAPYINKANAVNCISSGYVQEKCTYDATTSIDLTISDVAISNLKLFDYNYYRLRVRIASQYYDYNALAYLDNTIQFGGTLELKYTEVLKVGISKIYLRMNASEEYQEPNEKDYTGLIASLDLTEPLLTNQWAEYLASHKNYYMQTSFNNSMTFAKSGVNAITSGNTAEAGIKMGLGLIDLTANMYNQDMNKSDMQQTPNNLSNANGDPYFNCEVSDIKPKLDILDMAYNTKLIINERLNKQGYDFNRLVEISSMPEMFNFHRYYETVSFDIDKFNNVEMSEKEFERLKAKCSNVNRYWHTDQIDYANTMTNYVPIE